MAESVAVEVGSEEVEDAADEASEEDEARSISLGISGRGKSGPCGRREFLFANSLLRVSRLARFARVVLTEEADSLPDDSAAVESSP